MTSLPPSPARDVGVRPAPRIVPLLQLLRLPAALGLLALVAQPRNDLRLVRMGLYAPDTSFAAVWARITVAALAFALVVLVARRRTSPLPLLAVEAVTAGALAFVPPYLWAMWLDFHPISRAIDFEFVAPLSIAWFAIAITVLVAQLRDRAATARTNMRGTSPPADRGWVGDLPASLLPWLRIPLLLALIGLVAQQRDELMRVWVGAGNFELVWAQLTIPALAFVLVALVGRHHPTQWPPLAVETILAAALAFTPPHRWLGWLNWDDMAHALYFEFTSPLAIVWFATAVLTVLRQGSDSRRPHIS